MEHMKENKNKIENNEIVKPIIETSEKKISPEEFSDFLDSEKQAKTRNGGRKEKLKFNGAR